LSPSDLELLGYSARWVEYGFLSPELLGEQVRFFHTGADRNTEHYRYWAFKQLQRRPVFSPLEFERYVELAASDPDPTMGRAALIDLLHHPGITEAQEKALLDHPRLQELPRLVQRRRLLRELHRTGPTIEMLQRALEARDSHFQRTLLETPDLPRPIVEALHERGSNRAVRNLAGVMLKYLDRNR
jgi:hypothetical protein